MSSQPTAIHIHLHLHLQLHPNPNALHPPALDRMAEPAQPALFGLPVTPVLQRRSPDLRRPRPSLASTLLRGLAPTANVRASGTGNAVECALRLY